MSDPYPPEIAAVLDALEAGQPLTSEEAAQLRAEIDYLMQSTDAATTQLHVVTAKYDAALRILHAAEVLADNWDARARGLTTESVRMIEKGE